MSNVKYMAILHAKTGEWAQHGEEKQKEILERYYAWVGKLREKHGYEGGSELFDKYRTLKNVNGKVHVDGPYAETKEILTGYFIYHAGSLDEAAEIAKECPALTHGEWVQVYEMPDRKKS